MQRMVRIALLVDEYSHWAQAYTGTYKNILLEICPLEPMLQGETPEDGFKNWGDQLADYDIAIVAANALNLSWLRSQLHYARAYLRTPILAVVNNLQPLAIQDLLDAGAADFIMEDRFRAELSIRVKLLQFRLGKLRRSAVVTTTDRPKQSDEQALHEPSSLDAYAAAVAVRFATHEQPFQQAKRTMVQRFEKAYIRAVLDRNQGNITRAARSAQKHRRSFWELMRKHNIEATTYRESACPDQPSIR